MKRLCHRRPRRYIRHQGEEIYPLRLSMSGAPYERVARPFGAAGSSGSGSEYPDRRSWGANYHASGANELAPVAQGGLSGS